MTTVHHTAEDMREWRESWAANPGIAKLYELIVRHAERERGLTLAVWRLHMGQIFGEPIMMTPDDVAKRLKLPLAEVTAVIDATHAQVLRDWKSTQEYRESPFAP